VKNTVGHSSMLGILSQHQLWIWGHWLYQCWWPKDTDFVSGTALAAGASMLLMHKNRWLAPFRSQRECHLPVAPKSTGKASGTQTCRCDTALGAPFCDRVGTWHTKLRSRCPMTAAM
jgi:hypothetical protein